MSDQSTTTSGGTGASINKKLSNKVNSSSNKTTTSTTAVAAGQATGSSSTSTSQGRSFKFRGPSPVRFLSVTASYIFNLKSSGYSAPSALESLRQLIMGTLGGIVQVPSSYMFEHSLPSLPEVAQPEIASDVEFTAPEDLVTQVVNACISNGLIVGENWKGFSVDPKTRFRDKSGGKENYENGIYKDFGTLWNEIVDVAKAILPKDSDGNEQEPTVRFRSVPNTGGLGEKEGEDIKPDGILELVRSSMIKSIADRERERKGYCVCDAACPVEVKPEDNPDKTIDNVTKLSHNVNRYFADDLRRRAVYALEIENTDFRVLTYTRTGVIASEHFDWTKDHASLVRVILSLSFSSEEELGYDPNLRRVEVASPALPTDTGEITKKTKDAEETKDAVVTEDAEASEEQSERSSQSLPVMEPVVYEDTGPRKRPKTELHEEVAYEIIVDGRTFVTVGECISDYRADFFVGRATRVFQVYEKGDTAKNIYLLKMYYAPNNVVKANQVEGNILIEINAKSEILGCAKYFPTILCHGFPPIERKGDIKSDSSTLFLRTPVIALGFFPGVTVTRTRAKHTSSGRTIGGKRLRSQGRTYTATPPLTTGIPSSVTTNVEEFMECCFTRRYQYRMVTLEVGSPLQIMPDISLIFFALEETTHALEWLHEMGFLHRDLSIGNIIYIKLQPEETTEENKGLRIILNDFDSAKRIDKLNTGGAMRTGTPEFLSNELILGMYLHALYPSNNEPSEDNTQDDPSTDDAPGEPKNEGDDEENEEEDSSEEANDLKPHPNFLHESESLLWMGFWFLCYSVPSGYNAKATDEQNRNQWKLIHWIFQQNDPTRGNSHRLACFTSKKIMKNYFGMLPPDFQTLLPHFERLRALLMRTYREIESVESFNGASSYLGRRGDDSFYEGIADCFRSCQTTIKGWKTTTQIDRFISQLSNDPVSLPTVEKVDLTDPGDILQRPRGSSTTSAGTSSSIAGHNSLGSR